MYYITRVLRYEHPSAEDLLHILDKRWVTSKQKLGSLTITEINITPLTHIKNDTLSKRELEVAQLLAEGSSAVEVAHLLGITQKTVDSHRFNLMKKLGIHKVQQITIWAMRTGLIS